MKRMDKQQEAMNCEKYLISGDWYSYQNNIPFDVIQRAIKTRNEGIPTGIGKHPEKGWFILVTGQGPHFIWREW